MRALAAGLIVGAAAVVAVIVALVVWPEGDGDAPANDGDERAVCLRGEPFIADGEFPLPVAELDDRLRVSALRWAAHEGCERFVVDVAAEDGSPADAPGQVRAEVLRDLGVVRIALGDVESVEQDATEAVIDGRLARAAYAVRAEGGRAIEVDLHLADEAEAFVATARDPARVVVDLRPGGGAIPGPPATEESLALILQPRAGEETYPLTVTGYARTFEANVVVRVEQDGEDVYEDFTTATAWADAWGRYAFTIDDGPTGDIALHVGERSARDGTWQGAVVELTMRRS
jgi:hypothetical protein